MSPEQILGEKIDGRSDLFSLGATAYALLTGKSALAAENVVAIVTRVSREDPMPPSRLVPSIPAEVDYIVARALAKDRSDRYPDGKTLAEDVDDVMNGRAPRHRAHWTAPRRADGTVASMVADLAPASTLVPRTPRPPTPAARPVPASGALRGGRAAPPRSRVKIWAVLLAAALAGGAAAAVIVVRTLWSRPAASSASAEGDRRRGPVETIEDRSVGGASAPAETSGETKARTRVRRTAEGSGRLAIDFEHPLKSGTLKVWVDDKLMLDETLTSRAKKIVAVTLRKGSLREEVSVPAGEHDVRVEVAWDDQRKTGAVFGTIEADETRTLEIRMPPVLKTLSVDWK